MYFSGAAQAHQAPGWFAINAPSIGTSRRFLPKAKAWWQLICLRKEPQPWLKLWPSPGSWMLGMDLRMLMAILRRKSTLASAWAAHLGQRRAAKCCGLTGAFAARSMRAIPGRHRMEKVYLHLCCSFGSAFACSRVSLSPEQLAWQLMIWISCSSCAEGLP